MAAVRTNMVSKMATGGKSNMAAVDTKMAANMADINVNKMASKIATKNRDFTYYHSPLPTHVVNAMQRYKNGEIDI